MKSNLTILLLINEISANCGNNRTWKDKNGLRCYNYNKRYCGGGKLDSGFEFKGGHENGFPELNCCACGKASPTFY